LLVAGAVGLQVARLGPPRQQTAGARRRPDAAVVAPPAAAVPPAQAAGIPAPIAALQEPAPDVAGRRAATHRARTELMPTQAYAAPFDRRDARPRVAVLLAGIGRRKPTGEGGDPHHPAAVSLASRPMRRDRVRCWEMARRAAGHETLVSIPMEPLGYPLNDAGHARG